MEDFKQTIKTQLANIERGLLATRDVLDMDGLAALTGMSKSHLYKLTSEKKIPHYKPHGKHVYFKREEVEAWLTCNRVSTKEETEQRELKHIARKEAKL